MSRTFQLNIELIAGEPFVCLKDLIEMLEGSISTEGTKFDSALSALANHLKELKNKSTNPTEGFSPDATKNAAF